MSNQLKLSNDVFATYVYSNYSAGAVGGGAASTGISVIDFGADPTGIADSSAAFNEAVAAAAGSSYNKAILVPAGHYIFNQQWVLPSSINAPVVIVGEGSSCTHLIYNGTNAAQDCFVFGSITNTQAQQLEISGIRFRSNLTMTAGACAHFNGIDRALLRDVQFSSQDDFQSNGNKLHHGAWFNGCDFLFLDGFQAYAQQDGIRVTGTTQGRADFYAYGGKIGACTVGLHVAGGMGGVTVDGCDIIGNVTNVLIDDADNATGNREFFFGSQLALDSAAQINLDIQSGGLIFVNGTWNSSAGILLRTGATFTGVLYLNEAFFNNGNNLSVSLPGHAVQIGSATTRVVATGCKFSSIAGFGFTCPAGFNSSCSVNVPQIGTSVPTLFDNASISPSIIDSTTGVGGGVISATLATNATYVFSSFSGLLIICDTATGSVGAFICGGAAVVQLGTWTGVASGTLTSAGGGYTFTSTQVATTTYSFTPIRIRDSA